MRYSATGVRSSKRRVLSTNYNVRCGRNLRKIGFRSVIRRLLLSIACRGRVSTRMSQRKMALAGGSVGECVIFKLL